MPRTEDGKMVLVRILLERDNRKAPPSVLILAKGGRRKANSGWRIRDESVQKVAGEAERVRRCVGKLRRTGESPNITTGDSNHSNRLPPFLRNLFPSPRTTLLSIIYLFYWTFLLHQAIDHPQTAKFHLADLGILELQHPQVVGSSDDEFRDHEQSNNSGILGALGGGLVPGTETRPSGLERTRCRGSRRRP